MELTQQIFLRDHNVSISIIIGLILVYVTYQLFLIIFFSSTKFKNIKHTIISYINDCNDLNHHIETLKDSNIIELPNTTGISNLVDNSTYNFKRQNWNSKKHTFVYNCSLAICKKSSDHPFKYLCKYFNIIPSEETLSKFESILNNFEAVEQGKQFLINKRDDIVNNIQGKVPYIILLFSKPKLIQKLGFETIDLGTVYFPIFTFQYVSAGGNSSVKNHIRFDIENLNNFITYLNTEIKFKKSIKGQRSLMTSKLREFIKNRDGYTCQCCNISINDEKHLLLEIDHIIPVSKGGMTILDNLQTLCWKCNRSKGSQLIN